MAGHWGPVHSFNRPFSVVFCVLVIAFCCCLTTSPANARKSFHQNSDDSEAVFVGRKNGHHQQPGRGAGGLQNGPHVSSFNRPEKLVSFQRSQSRQHHDKLQRSSQHTAHRQRGLQQLQEQSSRHRKPVHSEDWESLLLKPLDKKYPKLRQLYKRTVGDRNQVSDPAKSQSVPKFELSQHQQSCKEDVPIGTNLLQVKAVLTGPGPLEYSLTDAVNFTIDNEGNIKSNSKLDADYNGALYTFNVTAKDISSGRESQTSVRVYTYNENDEAPTFSQAIYPSRVDENAKPNAVVTTVVAADKDGDKVRYGFVPGAGIPPEMFVMDSDTGVIRLGRGPLRFERDTYELNVTATDDGSCCENGGATIHTSTALVLVTIIDVNDNKPLFQDCDKYQPKLKENAAVGTFVVKVNATDKDRGENGRISYVYVPKSSSEHLFIVDEMTGEVRTNKVFDREGSDGKVVPITIIAKDNGSPPLEGVCAFKVLIEDVNDNKPIFDRATYNQNLKQETTTGSDVFRVSATDEDADNNAVIVYSLQPYAGNTVPLEYFEVNQDSGWVSLKKSLGALTKFHFLATAVDKGTPPLSATVEVSVEVVNKNINPPTWERPDYIIKVNENMAQDTVILTLKANSGINNDPRVGYSLVPGNTVQTNKKQTFYILPNADTDQAEIRIGKALDYEDIKEYNLTVRAENYGSQPMSTETTVYIQLNDVNDEIPQFADNEKLSVLEGEPSGTKVGQLHAIDKDSTYPFNLVTFALIGPPNVNDLFAIIPETGELTTKAVFDRELNQTIQITVKITDGAPSARSTAKPGEHNSFFSHFPVFIGDQNDNAPVFEKPQYEAQVKENEDIGHVVITVVATDKDQSSKPRYDITKGNTGSAFSIKTDTGTIVVAGNIDYETLNKYTLTVVTTDGLHEASTTVEIKVIDLNDNPPKFNQTTYEATIWERTSSNTSGLPEVILTVSARDTDPDRPKDNVYFLTGQANEIGPYGKKVFEIDSKSGAIRVNEPLDRDPPNGRPTWRFNVLARDEGGGPGSLDGYAEVVVHLRDINDNGPTFPEESYLGQVPENEPAGRSVMVMNAVDNDDLNEGTNAVLTYSIVENAMEKGAPLFTIDPNTALIKTAIGNLDRETTPEYVIKVAAKDGGGLTGTGTATIRIRDVNDSPPRFEEREYRIRIPETDGNSIPKDPILTMRVLDDDLPETNKNFFNIVPNSGPGWDRFQVIIKSSDTAALLVRQQLDYENSTHRQGFYFDVRVSDMGPNTQDPTHVAMCRVFVGIFDVNDNAPEFERVSQNVSVKEDVPTNTSIAKFHATDRDKNGTSVVSYMIQRLPHRNRHFSVDSSGTVYVLRQLDREEVQQHIVRILAIDDGSPTKTSTATLTVNVLDVNDNAPEFKNDYHPVVPENTPPGRQVIEVMAYDRDDYAAGNGPPFNFWLDEAASETIKTSFKFEYNEVGDERKGSAKIYTKVTFDREVQKQYFIPIVIKDAGKPPMSATNTLTVTIGDENDNEMGPGGTSIFVYNYRGKAPESEIGRVYVDDKDDWDLPDKTFSWAGEPDAHFRLDDDTGTIIMRNGTRGGVYVLYFTVYDKKFKNTVEANATITVKEISELAVASSGSIRMVGITEEEFISVWDSKENKPIRSKYDIMKELIAEVVKADIKNVELFTVKKKQGFVPHLDIRFSAHGSPYYAPEKLNGLLSGSRAFMEATVGVNVSMIGIDECLYENVNCESSCSNELEVSATPYVVNANRSSLAGVRAEVVAQCTCRARNFSRLENCGTLKCFNGGSCVTLPNGNVMCQCPRGFDGPRCQQTTIGFQQSGYAWFPSFQLCEESHLSLEFITRNPNGLIFYNGPISNLDSGEIAVQDFISLELVNGHPRLLIDLGSGTLELLVNEKVLNDEEWHRIDIYWSPEAVSMVVDFCESGERNDKEESHEAPVFVRTTCQARGSTPLFNEYLNVNAPLQLGGVSHPVLTVPGWTHQHSRVGFNGCIKSVTLNGELYDLATPSVSLFAQAGCPLTEDKCHANDVTPFCVNGTCIGSKTGVACDCAPGYSGDRCDQVSPEVTMNDGSYIQYTLQFEPDEFKSDIMLRFRTHETNGELFYAAGKNVKEFLRLEISNGHLLYRFNLHSSGREEELLLESVTVNDGQWHSVHLSRRGSLAMISLDGGEGRRYKELLVYEGLHQLLSIQNRGIYVGGHLDGAELKNDFRNSCMSDVRFDTRLKQLPLPPVTTQNKYADAEAHNVDGYCPRTDSCLTVLCPDGMDCLEPWGFPICSCALGYAVGVTGKCEDVDECDTFPCLNGGSCENLEGTFACQCVAPYGGKLCESHQEQRQLVLGIGALAAILVCALSILILALVLVVYTRSRRTNYGPVFPEDDIRENIINYNDEGGGEDDMNTYDIGALRIPVDHMGTPLGVKPGMERPPKESRQNRGYSPGSEPDVGDFINNNLGKADEDQDALPSDDVRLYAYEGAGSTAGSLSSLASGTDDNEQDFDYLNNWGPRFQKLADMYGQGESEEE